MNAQLNTGLFGEYRIVVKRQDQTIQDTGWFKNLILNSGLDVLGADAPSEVQIFGWCKVGTGTTTPAITQTALQAQVAETSSDGLTVTSPVGPDYICQKTFFYEFNIGQIVATIAEIGVGWMSGPGALFSRALILDGSGNPTTISLTSMDQLQVYYRINYVPSVDDFSSSFVIGATTYNYTGRHMNIGSFSPETYPQGFSGYNSTCSSYGTDFALGSITGGPSGTGLGSNSSKTVDTYIGGNYYLDITYTWNTTTGNGGAIKGLVFNLAGGNMFQVELDQGIPKDNTKVLTITIRNSWNRI